MPDDGKLRNGDLEGLNKHISSLQTPEKLQNPENHAGNYPDKGRIATDANGKMVMFDNVNGNPKITWYEGENAPKNEKKEVGSYGRLVVGQNLICPGNAILSARGRDNFDRIFKQGRYKTT
jgi:hypothetical protein